MRNFYLGVLVAILIAMPSSLKAQESLFVFDSTRILGPAFKNQGNMNIAFNGSLYFVFWGDTREYTIFNPANLYGARVQQNNFTLLDSLGLKLSETTDFLACASDSTNFLIVKGSLEAQILDTTGNPICPPFQISSHNLNSTLIGATFGGGNYFVVWHDHASPGYIRGARITPSGVVIDTNTIVIATGSDLWFPSTCSGGGYYCVVWRQGNNQTKIYASRVTYDGTVIDTNGILVATQDFNFGPDKPKVAFGDSLWLIVFESWYISGGIGAVRMDINGNILDPNPIVISLEWTGEWEASVNYDGENFGVFYTNGYGYVWGKFVNRYGQIVNSCLVSPLNYGFISTSIFDGTNYIIAYENTWDVYAAQVRPDGYVISSDILLTYSAYGQEKSRTAFDGTNYLVVWQDQRNSAWYPNIYGARIGKDGTVYDPQGFGIAIGQQWLCNPDITYNGANYLVAWRKGRPGYETYEQPDVWASRVSRNGVVLDNIPIATSESFWERDPAVASDGDKYLVTFTSNEGDWYSDIMGILVNSDGSIVPPGRFPITYGDGYSQSISALCFGDSIYFCCWWDGRDATNWPNIYGARISRSGFVLDYGGFPIIVTQNIWRGVYGEKLEIGFDGTNFLLVWSEKRPSAADWDIYGCRVSLDGTVLDPGGLPIYIGSGDQRQPTITYDGTNYWIFFTDGRGQDGNILGVKMTPGGVIVDSVLLDYPYAQHYPFLAKGPQEQVFLTYTGFLDESYKTMRIWGRLYPPLGIAETALRTNPNVPYLEVCPNPFHQMATIKFQIPNPNDQINSKSQISLKIYDATGRLVRQFNHLTNYSFNQVVWDGTDDFGRRLPAGIYFIRLESDGFKETEKVILLR
jgi:hypothetical protein